MKNEVACRLYTNGCVDKSTYILVEIQVSSVLLKMPIRDAA
jgi:hypothetical protein